MSVTTEMRERLQHAPRIDMRAKVTGSAKYIEDLPEPAGLLYGAVLTSHYSHAKIVSIDASEASHCLVSSAFCIAIIWKIFIRCGRCRETSTSS